MSYTVRVSCFHFDDGEGKEAVCISLPHADSPDDKSKLQDALFYSLYIPGDFVIAYHTDTDWILRGHARLLEALKDQNIDKKEWRHLVFSTKPPSR